MKKHSSNSNSNLEGLTRSFEWNKIPHAQHLSLIFWYHGESVDEGYKKYRKKHARSTKSNLPTSHSRTFLYSTAQGHNKRKYHHSIGTTTKQIYCVAYWHRHALAQLVSCLHCRKKWSFQTEQRLSSLIFRLTLTQPLHWSTSWIVNSRKWIMKMNTPATPFSSFLQQLFAKMLYFGELLTCRQ